VGALYCQLSVGALKTAHFRDGEFIAGYEACRETT